MFSESELKNRIGERSLCIWGTGLLSEVFSNYYMNIAPIDFYISRDADARRMFNGCPVYLREEVCLSPNKHYVVVLADKRYREIRQALQANGFIEDLDYLDIENPYESSIGTRPSRYALWNTYADHLDKRLPEQVRFKMIGSNFGNLVHWYALRESIPMHLFSPSVLESATLEGYDAVITPHLICITEDMDFNWALNAVNAIGDMPIVPISVGVCCERRKSDFHMHETAVRALKRISEHCAVIGVRGAYTAEVLDKYGVKNTRVIGCPSLYYPYIKNRIKRVERSDESIKATANYPAPRAERTKRLLDYMIRNGLPGVCQGMTAPTEYPFNDRREPKDIRYFFSVDEWDRYVRQFNFFIGARFHGGVVPIWNSVPSLFLTHDTRMRKMCEFFHLPHMELSDFDSDKPLEYYYDAADYSEFNKRMPALVDEYRDFLAVNSIII